MAFFNRLIDSQAFDKTLFHFLLSRLGKAGDDFAIDFCVKLLPERPEETSAILLYLERVGKVSDNDAQLAAFLESTDAIYAYQNYQIAECRLRDDNPCADELLCVFRDFAFDPAQPAYLRSQGRALLGKFGTPADLERLEHSYPEARGTEKECEYCVV